MTTMKQDIKCEICGAAVRGHKYQLPEFMAFHIGKYHPQQWERLCEINAEVDRLADEARQLGVHHRDLFYYHK